MPELSFDWLESYIDFVWSVKHRARHVLEDKAQAFLDGVAATSKSRMAELRSGAPLWRAQLGHAWQTEGEGDSTFEVPAQFPPERMSPLPGESREGRINPKGIPCLYLSTNRDTAMAEVRPWIGSYVSVGQFKTQKDLLLMDLSREREPKDYVVVGEQLKNEPQDYANGVWTGIAKAFSEPVNATETTADYAPTQILAELFRKIGCDGIRYASLLGPGHTIALFDIDVAEIVNCFLFYTQSTSFHFEEAANPYFMLKHYPELATRIKKSSQGSTCDGEAP